MEEGKEPIFVILNHASFNSTIMRRARHPLPPCIGDLKFNTKSNRYEITDNRITYSMDLEHTRLLKKYFRSSISVSISDWFDKLDRQTKKEIYREGNLPDTTVTYYDGHHL